jgi:hypothetical protein
MFQIESSFMIKPFKKRGKLSGHLGWMTRHLRRWLKKKSPQNSAALFGRCPAKQRGCGGLSKNAAERGNISIKSNIPVQLGFMAVQKIGTWLRG